MLAKPILKRILHFRSLAMKYHKPFALDGVELVRRKVARAVVMGGAFADAAEPEYNFVRKQNGKEIVELLFTGIVRMFFSAHQGYFYS